MSSKGTKEKSIPTPVTDDRDMQSFTSVAGNGRSFSTCASTRLGTRKSQEDRLLMCEDFFGHCVLAVFDGTVGDFASHFSQGHFLHFLGESPSFQQLCKSLEEVAEGEEIPESVAKLQEKWKLQQGGNKYLFFTTIEYDKKIVLICSKILDEI